MSRAETHVQTKRLGKEIQGWMIEQISSWGMFQKKQVSSREKNTADVGLGPFSRGCLAQRQCVVAHCVPLARC